VCDATVPRFNPPAEPARTVGRTDKQILYGRTGPDRRPLYNFDQRLLVRLSVTVGIKVDISVVLKRVLKKNQISTSNCLEPDGSLKFFHPPKLGALFDFANFQIPGTINSLRPCVRPSDATVPHFNCPGSTLIGGRNFLFPVCGQSLG
jgi:hypothetical protein